MTTRTGEPKAARTEEDVQRRRQRRRQKRPAAALSLTARGGIAAVFVLSLAGALLDFSFLPGLVFVAACVLAAMFTKPADLPTLVVAPPVVYFLATLTAELAATLSGGSVLRSLFIAVPLELGARAPWLLAGTALAFAIAWRRGLPEVWREISLKASGFRLTQERQTEEDPVRWDD
ncbi:DUF6542 domain-containing protein [Actinocorallia populi]|uniref:DUF6542 domain-containing protein n=1 Tax=Actinocorallia populi TaxID=2079200 RepID=UPI000D08BF31|nr:DUF6542 domain-containing protein [Actinocorallia populi]